jgi:hypothetical protein
MEKATEFVTAVATIPPQQNLRVQLRSNHLFVSRTVELSPEPEPESPSHVASAIPALATAGLLDTVGGPTGDGGALLLGLDRASFTATCMVSVTHYTARQAGMTVQRRPGRASRTSQYRQVALYTLPKPPSAMYVRCSSSSHRMLH